MERTLVIIKPCALQRGLAGEIISRFEKKGLKLVALKMYRFTKEKCAEHYSHLVGKSFYPITSTAYISKWQEDSCIGRQGSAEDNIGG